MLKREFGSTGIEVPVIGLGTWEMKAAGLDAMRVGIELGMTHIDTAEMYTRIGRGRCGSHPWPKEKYFSGQQGYAFQRIVQEHDSRMRHQPETVENRLSGRLPRSLVARYASDRRHHASHGGTGQCWKDLHIGVSNFDVVQVKRTPKSSDAREDRMQSGPISPSITWYRKRSYRLL